MVVCTEIELMGPHVCPCWCLFGFDSGAWFPTHILSIYSLKSNFLGDSDSCFPKSKQPDWIYGKINIENNVLV